MAATPDACFEIDKFMHGALARKVSATPASDSNDEQNSREIIVTALREFYENKFMELTQD